MTSSQKDNVYLFDLFSVDESRRTLRNGEEQVPLNPKAFDLLVALIERHGQVISKEELLGMVWPDQFVEEGNLTVHISTLRKALGDRKASHRYIITVPGKGYKFVGNVTVSSQGFAIEEHTVSQIEIVEETAIVADRPAEVRPVTALADPVTSDLTLGAPTTARSRLDLRFAAVIVAGFVLISGSGYWLLSQWRSDWRGAISQNTRTAISGRALTSYGDVDQAAISRDGKYFVYTRYKNGLMSLWVANAAEGKPVEIRPASDADFCCLSFSPDGNYIWSSMRDKNNPAGGLFQIPVLGGPAKKLLDGINGPYSVSSDGTRVAFVRNDTVNKKSVLVEKAVTDGKEREISELPLSAGFAKYSSWSPDDKYIAVGAASRDDANKVVLTKVDVQYGSTSALHAELWDKISSIVWLRDNSGIVFHSIGSRSNLHIWELDLRDQTLNQVTNDVARYGTASLNASDDGNSLLVVRGESSANIWLRPSSGADNLHQITDRSLGNLAGSAGVAWTPAGTLVYSMFSNINNSYSLWTVGADGQNDVQITSNGFNDTYPSVSGDGRYIVFQSNRNGGNEIWRVNMDGSGLKQLVSGEGNSHPQITPDGKWVLYASREDASTAIWKVSIEGGEPSRLTGIGVDLPYVSPDGRFFAASYAEQSKSSKAQLAVFPIDGGSPAYRFDLAQGGTFGSCIRWSPDGGSIAYRNYSDGLWVQNLSGGEPAKMPNLPSKKVYSFDWSKDSKQFTASVGDDVRDVQVISNFR